MGEVDAFDELDQEIADGVVEGADFPAIDLRDGDADGFEEGQLGGFALERAVHAVRRNLADDFAGVFELEQEGRVDAAADERLDLDQLRRSACPFLHDSTERIPRNVDGSDRHEMR